MISDESKTIPPPPSRAPRRGLLLMACVLIAMGLLSIFANYEKRHLNKIEKVTITNSPPPPLPSPTQSPNE